MYKVISMIAISLSFVTSAQAGERTARIHCVGNHGPAKYDISFCVSVKEHKQENEVSELPIVACKGAKVAAIVVKKTSKGQRTTKSYEPMSQFNKLYEDGFEIFTYLNPIDDRVGPHLISIKGDYVEPEVGITLGRSEFIELAKAKCTLI